MLGGRPPENLLATREEAEVAALVAQYDHNAPELTVYKCEYGNHWHLSSHRQPGPQQS